MRGLISWDLEHAEVAGVLEEADLSWSVEHLNADLGSRGDVRQSADEARLVLVGSLGDRGDARERLDTVDHDAVADVLVRVIVHHLNGEKKKIDNQSNKQTNKQTNITKTFVKISL